MLRVEVLSELSLSTEFPFQFPPQKSRQEGDLVLRHITEIKIHLLFALERAFLSIVQSWVPRCADRTFPMNSSLKHSYALCQTN